MKTAGNEGGITFRQSKNFMDYLHGDVEKSESQLACAYEYARESKELLEAARRRDELLRKSPNLSCEQAVLWILRQDAILGRLHPMWEWRFLMCKSFPAKDWNALLLGERKEILNRYETRCVPPLLLLDLLWTPPQTMAMHAEFNRLAVDNTPAIPEVRPGDVIPPMKPVPAMGQKHGSVYWCLFDVDFSESNDRLADRFLAWLNQPAIVRLWQEHKKQKTGMNRKPLRALKERRDFNAHYHCLFEVDLSASKGNLTRQFKRWLALPKNRKRLNRYGKEKRGIAGQPLDRLKDLAAWRLYRENENDFEQANKFATLNRKKFKDSVEIYRTCKKKSGKWQYKHGEPRPFHNAKAAKNLHSVPTNQADLFSCDEDYRHAKIRAVSHLSDSYPREFKKPSLAKKNIIQELRKIASKRQ